MSRSFKFPGGYDVTVVNKDDILKCIDDNIIDKEVAYALIENCEYNIAKFINEGRWTSVPYIGTIRVPPRVQLALSPEQKDARRYARENLNTEDYLIFKKQLDVENKNKVKLERYYKYVVSINANKHKILFNDLCKEKGIIYARIYFYSMNNITAVDNEYVLIDEEL